MHQTLDSIQCIKCTIKLKVILTGNYLSIVSCNIIISKIVFFSISQLQRTAYFERVSFNLVSIRRGLFMHAYPLCNEFKELLDFYVSLEIENYYVSYNCLKQMLLISLKKFKSFVIKE